MLGRPICLSWSIRPEPASDLTYPWGLPGDRGLGHHLWLSLCLAIAVGATVFFPGGTISTLFLGLAPASGHHLHNHPPSCTSWWRPFFFFSFLFPSRCRLVAHPLPCSTPSGYHLCTLALLHSRAPVTPRGDLLHESGGLVLRLVPCFCSCHHGTSLFCLALICQRGLHSGVPQSCNQQRKDSLKATTSVAR